MIKQLFDDAIGEEPPPTFDVEAIITRIRRADRIRRVATPAVATGIAVVLVIGAVALTMIRSGSSPVGSPPSTTRTDPPPPSTTDYRPEPPPACARPDLETAAEVNARLTGAAKGIVQAQRPEVDLRPNPVGGAPGPALQFFQSTPSTPFTNLPICTDLSSFQAFATTEAPEGAGNITIVVAAAYTDTPGECGESIGATSPCENSTLSDGTAVVKYWPDTDADVASQQVGVVRPDGTLVRVDAQNVATSIKTSDEPTATEPPLTMEQLLAIATDPALTLFP